jgi:hypothetical protein
MSDRGALDPPSASERATRSDSLVSDVTISGGSEIKE